MVKFSVYLNRLVFVMNIAKPRTMKREQRNRVCSFCFFVCLFSLPKKENFQIKNSGIFHIPAQNIDCGYSLEPPRRVPTIYVVEQK